ncbi:unnamed protein product, partial [marine sediment metagenome]
QERHQRKPKLAMKLESTKPTRYHHQALIDFDHCEKGRCINCSLKQMHKCEEAMDRKHGKPRFPYTTGHKP